MKTNGSRIPSASDEVLVYQKSARRLIKLSFSEEKWFRRYRFLMMDFAIGERTELAESLFHWKDDVIIRKGKGLTYASNDFTLCFVRKEDRRRTLATAPGTLFPGNIQGVKMDLLMRMGEERENELNAPLSKAGFMKLSGDDFDLSSNDFEAFYIPMRFDFKKRKDESTLILFHGDETLFFRGAGTRFNLDGDDSSLDLEGAGLTFAGAKSHLEGKVLSNIFWKDGKVRHYESYIEISGNIGERRMERADAVLYSENIILPLGGKMK